MSLNKLPDSKLQTWFSGNQKRSIAKSYNRYSDSQAVAVPLNNFGFGGMEFISSDYQNTRLKRIHLAQARFVRAGNSFPVSNVTIAIDNFILFPQPIDTTGIPVGFNTNDSLIFGFNGENVIEIDIPLNLGATINAVCWLTDGTAGFLVGDNIFIDIVIEMETVKNQLT